jgi:hypothetical protein
LFIIIFNNVNLKESNVVIKMGRKITKNASRTVFLMPVGVLLRIISVITLLYLLSAFSTIPAGSIARKGYDPVGSRIAFEKTEFDFGVIRYGSEAVHFFVFSNTGDAPLVILNVRTSCGCTVSEWPKAPIASGAKDSLRVEYNTKVKGVFNKTITVQSNAGNALVELRIKGNVTKTK